MPCIASDDFPIDSALKSKAVMYPNTHIEFIFEKMINGDLKKENFAQLKNIPLPEEYSPEFQRIYYKKIINSVRLSEN
jgi:hypothetical protein